jgi:hypothetical protein
VTNRIRTALAVFLIAFSGMLTSSCTTGRHPEPVRDTWTDPESTIPIIDVAIAKPRVVGKHEPMVAPAMREAARRVMLDQKAYSIVANEVVDAAMERAGMDANGDASAASQVVDADAVILISITRWDDSELIPRGRIYASGSIKAAGRPNGRRIFEHTFQNEILLSPGELTPLNRDEAEKQMAADFVTQTLAAFRKKQ